MLIGGCGDDERELAVVVVVVVVAVCTMFSFDVVVGIDVEHGVLSMSSPSECGPIEDDDDDDDDDEPGEWCCSSLGGDGDERLSPSSFNNN